MKLTVILSTLLSAQLVSAAASASPAVETMLLSYRDQGVTQFNREAGRQFWTRAFTSSEDGQVRRCSSCHTEDPRNNGKHAKTGKAIEPLAPSINAKRLTEVKEIRKWFSRNCKWTLGRECSAQEQGDVLMYLQGL